jgi:hypothetical protein
MTRNMKYLFIAFLASAIVSCQNFLDINKNPRLPETAPYNLTLPAIQFSIGYYLGNVTGGLNNAGGEWTHQILARNDNYAMGATYTANSWNGLFTDALNNLEIMRKTAERDGDFRYLAIAKILKAYTYSMLVDVFGDLPFSEAALGVENLAPKYDKDSDIYIACFNLLEDAKLDLVKVGGRFPATDDIFYGGDINKWRRLANTISLKMYNQVRKVQDVSSQVSVLLTANDLINTQADDFQLVYGPSTAPSNRNPAFLANYAGSSREAFVSRWIYDIMQGRVGTAFANITDPRVPYYFYNQKSNTNVESTANYQDGRFVTRIFGSGVGGLNVVNIQTLLGLYPIGGRYDDGVGGTGSGTSGAGLAPQRLLTFANQKFIEAELYLEVLNNQANARAALISAINASFAKVNQIAAAVPSNIQNIPQIADATRDTYRNSIITLYDAGSNTRKLEIIMTQKWLNNFGAGIDAYTDYRRTGFPLLFDPNTDLDPTTSATNPYPVRFTYSDLDLTTNPNAPVRPNIYADKIFWHKF